MEGYRVEEVAEGRIVRGREEQGRGKTRRRIKVSEGGPIWREMESVLEGKIMRF